MSIASRVAKRYIATLESIPPVTPEDIDLAVKTFEYEIGDAEKHVRSDYPSVTVNGKFQFRGMTVPFSFSTSGDLELSEATFIDGFDPIENIDDDEFEKWFQTYVGDIDNTFDSSPFNWHPLLQAIESKHQHVEGYIQDKFNDYRDRQEESADPDRYYGVKGQFGP